MPRLKQGQLVSLAMAERKESRRLEVIKDIREFVYWGEMLWRKYLTFLAFSGQVHLRWHQPAADHMMMGVGGTPHTS